jgi:hypothetical protein
MESLYVKDIIQQLYYPLHNIAFLLFQTLFLALYCYKN